MEIFVEFIIEFFPFDLPNSELIILSIEKRQN